MNPYLYRPGDTILHRLDPRAKIIILLLSFVAVSVQASVTATATVTILILIWAVMGRALHGISNIRVVLVSILLISTVIWGFLYRQGGLSFEGIIYGAICGVKIDVMIIAGVVFLSVTRHEEVGWGLLKMGIPYRVTFVISMALRLVPVFIGSAYTVMQAQAARGLDLSGGSPVVRVRRYLALFSPLLLSSLRVTGPLTQALESRGFSRKGRTSIQEYRWRLRDSLVVAGWISVAGIYIFIVLY